MTFLNLCDELRNKTMPPLGVKIVDDVEPPFFFVDPEQLKESVKPPFVPLFVCLLFAYLFVVLCAVCLFVRFFSFCFFCLFG